MGTVSIVQTRTLSINVVAKTDINAIFVHPLGEETLQHVTREYVAGLLKTLLNFGVFFQFGMKLYSLEQNMNFRARKRYMYVKVRSGGTWVTVSKNEAYDRIPESLVERAQEAVNMFGEGIPESHMNHFNTYAETILDFKNSSHPMRRREYEKVRNKGLDNIAVSMNDRIGRLQNWGGQKLKLV